MNIVIIHQLPIIQNEISLLISQQYPSSNIFCYNSILDCSMNTVNKDDILILNLDDENNNFISDIKIIHYRGVKVLLWIQSNDETKIRYYLKQKFSGYFLNEINYDVLTKALHNLQKNIPYLQPNLASILLKEYMNESNDRKIVNHSLLSKREWEVLTLMAEGCNNEKVARTLYLTESTIKNHVSSILRKLDVPDRTSAVIKALKNKWITLQP